MALSGLRNFEEINAGFSKEAGSVVAPHRADPKDFHELEYER